MLQIFPDPNKLLDWSENKSQLRSSNRRKFCPLKNILRKNFPFQIAFWCVHTRIKKLLRRAAFGTGYSQVPFYRLRRHLVFINAPVSTQWNVTNSSRNSIPTVTGDSYGVTDHSSYRLASSHILSTLSIP